MDDVTENYSKSGLPGGQIFVSRRVTQSKSHHRFMFTVRRFSAERKCLSGAKDLKMDEQH
jgi:hypothetical protein